MWPPPPPPCPPPPPPPRAKAEDAEAARTVMASAVAFAAFGANPRNRVMAVLPVVSTGRARGTVSRDARLRYSTSADLGWVARSGSVVGESPRVGLNHP